MRAQVRFCPSGEPTSDVWLHFEHSLPRCGDLVQSPLAGGPNTFRVVDVHWFVEGVYVDQISELGSRETPRMVPLVVAHSLDRPRAQA